MIPRQIGASAVSRPVVQSGMIRRSPPRLSHEWLPRWVWQSRPIRGHWTLRNYFLQDDQRNYRQGPQEAYLTSPSKLDRYDDPVVNRFLAEHVPHHPKIKFAHQSSDIRSKLSWVHFRTYRPWFLNWWGVWGGYVKALITFVGVAVVVTLTIIEPYFGYRLGFLIVPTPSFSDHGPLRRTHRAEWREHLHKLGMPLQWRWWDDLWTPWDLKHDLAAEFGATIPKDSTWRFPQGATVPFGTTTPIWEHTTAGALSPRELGVDLVLPDKRTIQPHPLLGPGGMANIDGTNKGLHPAHSTASAIHHRGEWERLQ